MITQLLIAVIAFWLGLKLPDIDLAPLLWRHRSAWTHGPFWALIVPLFTVPWWGVYIPAALLGGIAFHLGQDAFPKQWMGAALINTSPLRYRFGKRLSFLYIAGSFLFTSYQAYMALLPK